jgi:hypothetical protein
MGVMLLIISALVGIGIDENRRAVMDLRATTRRLEDVIQVNSNRLTHLEGTYDSQQRQLNRIELGVDRLILQHGNSQ